jgi:hemolysin activation/secretion protein
MALTLAGGWVAIRHLPDDAQAEPVAVGVRPQEVLSVSLDGRELPVAALRDVLETRAGTLIDLATVQRDRAALTKVLSDRGYLAARVDQPRVTFGAGGAVYVTFSITQGPLFKIRNISVSGASASEAGVVTLAGGEVADADRIALTRRAVEARLKVRGKQGAVQASLALDTAAGLVDLQLTAH